MSRKPTIRNAVIHIINEQPLLADLFDLPTATDLSLVCTNLRNLNGSRPVFADRIESIFIFPYSHIRFVEIPPEPTAGAPGRGRDATSAAEEPADEAELEIDEDFLKRIRDV